MSQEIKVPSSRIRELVLRARRGLNSGMESPCGLAYWRDRWCYLVATRNESVPYRAVLSVKESDFTPDLDFFLWLHLDDQAVEGYCNLTKQPEPIEVRVCGSQLTAPSVLPTSVDNDLSRLIGALGGSIAQVLAMAKIGIIGCGGLGSEIAGLLARGGCQSLVLVDGDLLESSNLHRMPIGLDFNDLGREKVAVVGRLVEQASGTRPVTLAEPFGSQDIRIALRDLDLIVVATDTIASRRACATFAADYLIPAVGVGTGVFVDAKGFEVGISLPGEGCLNCLMNVPKEGDFEFGIGRAGSLASLNAIAAGYAVRLIEDFAAGKIERSTAWRYLWNNGLTPIIGSRATWCNCRERSGIGDFGLNCPS